MNSWSYGRCSECNGKRQVFPSGPRSARIMLIGEGPGANEDRLGIPFVGQSGKEQDHTYFSLAGIERKDVFVTNCVQCRCERGGVDVRPSEKVLKACVENHLIEEICTINPEVIILAGATACSLFGLDLELEHGLPRKCGDILGTGLEAWLVPMYHPAAGLRDASRYMTPLLEDWKNLGRWLRGEWEPPRAPTERTDYRLIERPEELDDIDISREMAIDTESDEGVPYSIQFSQIPGLAYMVLASNSYMVRCLRRYLESMAVVFHNAIYDLSELARMGIRVKRFRDTMQEIYHLGGILPQGLKQAVYRIFGYRMTSYDEVVTPASKAKLETWLNDSFAHVVDNMRPSISHLKGKGCPACGKNHRADKMEWHPHEAEAVLRRAMGKLDTDYDPWQQPKYEKGEFKPRLIGRSWLEEIERAIGRMPRPSIVHAPMDRQIQYACGDADWTLRLATWLTGERQRIVNAEWRVA